MPASRPCLMLLLSTAMLLPQSAAAGGMVRLASDEWCPFVCVKEGRVAGGFLVDAAAQALASQGYHVEPVLMPLNRAILQANTGNIEGVYAPPLDARLRLSAPVAWSRACFYTRSGGSWVFHGMQSLQAVKVGVIGEYGYDGGEMDAYILRRRADHGALDFSFGATAGTTNLQKLLGGRFQVLLEHEAVADYLSHAAKAEGQLRKAGCLAHPLPLTIGFAQQDDRSDAWIRALADGVRNLELSGTFGRLREQYGIP